MAHRYLAQHQVNYYEGDTKGQMTLAMLINVALLVAGQQNDQLGVGATEVQKHGIGWVVTQYEIAIQRMPKVGETVTFGTVATAYNKFFCYRDLWVETQAGERIVTIHSMWVMMDYQTRKMRPIISEIIKPYAAKPIKGVLKRPRITHVDSAQASPAQPYRVRYFDIDRNQHVNNSHYFDWMLDHLGYDFLSQHDITHVVIRYEREVQYGNVPTSQYQQVHTTDNLITRHVIMNQGQRCAEAEIYWQAHKA